MFQTVFLCFCSISLDVDGGKHYGTTGFYHRVRYAQCYDRWRGVGKADKFWWCPLDDIISICSSDLHPFFNFLSILCQQYDILTTTLMEEFKAKNYNLWVIQSWFSHFPPWAPENFAFWDVLTTYCNSQHFLFGICGRLKRFCFECLCIKLIILFI